MCWRIMSVQEIPDFEMYVENVSAFLAPYWINTDKNFRNRGIFYLYLFNK